MATHNKIQLTIKQVYLPAIKGYVPDEMVKALWAFLEFCYIAQHNVHDMQSINELEDALQCYHHHRKIFLDTGVWTGFNLPHQHTLIHYAKAIRLFGSPNGLCSSITESKHIKAVKEPWQWSSRFNALGQMLLTSQRIDKLAAARADFMKWGMLQGTCLSWILIKLGMLQSFNSSDIHLNFIYTGIADGLGHPVQEPGANPNVVPHVAVAREEDEDGEDVAGPTVQAHVELVKTVGK